MPHPREASLLDSLPAVAATELRKAFSRDVDPRAAAEAIRAALTAVDFPTSPHPVPLAAELTPQQRAIAEVLAYRRAPRVMTLGGFSMPQTCWNLRRWLGLDAGGALDQRDPKTKNPIWCTFARIDEPEGYWAGVAVMYELLERLPVEKRLGVYCEIALGAYEINSRDLAPFPKLAELGDEGRTWAPRFADWFLSDDGPAGDDDDRFVPAQLKAPLYVALVRSGVKLEERWDVFIPLEGEEAIVRECLEAIPPARREAVIVAGLEGMAPHPRVDLLLSFLRWFPSRELLRLLSEGAKLAGRAKMAEVAVAVKALVASHPTLAGSVKGAFVVAKQQPRLVFKRLPMPKKPGPLLAMQLEYIAFAKVEPIELYQISNGKKVVYHAIIAGGDGGVFEVGDNVPVASFVQNGADVDDTDLQNSLDEGFQAYLKTSNKKPPARRKPKATEKRRTKQKRALKATKPRKSLTR